MKGRIATILLFLPVALASPLAADEYQCDDNTRLIATYEVPPKGLGSVQLALADTDEQIVLPQVAAADGVRYAGGVTEFLDQGLTSDLQARGSSDDVQEMNAAYA